MTSHMAQSQVFYFFLKLEMWPLFTSAVSRLTSVLLTVYSPDLLSFLQFSKIAMLYLSPGFFSTHCIFCLMCSISMPSIHNFYSPSPFAWIITTYVSYFSIYIHFSLNRFCEMSLSSPFSTQYHLRMSRYWSGLSNFHALCSMIYLPLKSQN